LLKKYKITEKESFKIISLFSIQFYFMSNSKSVIVIGAGIGGIATAGYFAKRGHDVTIFEKNAFAGGRCGNFVKDGHRFDTGATFLMMPWIYERTFSSVGKIMKDEIDLLRIDPIYKIKFRGEKEIRYTSDLAKLQSQLEKIETGSYRKFLRLMDVGYRVYKDSMQLIDRNYYNLFDLAILKYPLLLYRYKAFHNHYRFISRYFKSKELRALFTFQNLYLGQNPFTASGLYFMLPFMELADGVLFPKGGMHTIAESLLSAGKQDGVKVLLNSPVKKIEVNKSTARGITLEDGSFHPADIIVANADLPYVYKNLLPGSRKANHFNRLKYSCSAVVFHWGIDKVFPQLLQHTVFVSDKHKESCDQIFKDKVLPDEPSIYVHSPVRSDKSAAPENQDSITAIVHTGNIKDPLQYDWEELRNQARKLVFKRFEEEGMTDFEKHIKFEVCFTPESWDKTFNLTKGGTFGSLGHNILQMGFLRPGNQHKKYRNLFFVGGSTQPGSGMPLALTSAKLVNERIEKTINNT
jgi:phytoene desaturase